MCLIITAVSALLSYIFLSIYKKESLKDLFVMLSSAALMWTVDCSFAFYHGEDFFDLSADDTILGVIVIASALSLEWLILVKRKIAIFVY